VADVVGTARQQVLPDISAALCKLQATRNFSC